MWKRNYVLSDASKHFSSKLAPKYVPCVVTKVISRLVYRLAEAESYQDLENGTLKILSRFGVMTVETVVPTNGFFSLCAWEREYDVWVVSYLWYECEEWMSTTFFFRLWTSRIFSQLRCVHTINPDFDNCFSILTQFLLDSDVHFQILTLYSRF